MGIPRDIVALYRRLAEEGTSLFGASAERILQERSDVAAIARESGGDGRQAVLVAIQALAVLEQELQPRMIDAEFVATLPSTASTAARPTEVVVKEMLAGARREVIAVGYEIDEPGILGALQDAARRAPVTLILDRVRSAEAHPLATWPEGVPRPAVFHDAPRAEAAKYAKMHGKALLVDSNDLLVSSANFTFHGMRGNVEFGVRLRGPVAARAGDLFRVLVQSGLLERMN